ncbi:MAG: peptidase [Chloroflexi bacterium]|nr:peptidase [Chloroflexota bacterium]
MVQALPYGTWPSSLSAKQVANESTRLLDLQVNSGILYWIEGRASEGGRQAIVQHVLGSGTREISSGTFNARTRVHEYGGGSYWVDDDVVFAARFEDQRLYRISNNGAVHPITDVSLTTENTRYADGQVTPDRRRIYCVREQHFENKEPINEIVVLAVDGSEQPRAVSSGTDFVSAPRISNDGTRLAWISWDHPRMPWDGTELWTASICPDGTLDNIQLVCGGVNESVVQPSWSPEDALHYISDRSSWWNLYRLESDGTQTALAPMAADFASPDWVFGLSTYGFSSDGTLICTYETEEGAKLAALTTNKRELTSIECPWTSISYLHVDHDQVFFLGASETHAESIVSGKLDGSDWQVIARSRTDELDTSDISRAEHITFPTTNNNEAHALFYAPKNSVVNALSEEQPPLLVMSHGGPTGAATRAYNATIQYWTTRGIAVVDVNYRGSSGFGREYRRALNGFWGIFDTDDCIAAANYLANRGSVDGKRMAIRGGSAGGYTTLCALTFHDVFRAGASYFGIANAETLLTNTHKFESRYLDGLIGPYPEEAATYRARSPIHFADRIKAAVILFQGLEDEIVRPEQAEQMIVALNACDLPHAYLTFEGEQHGFRKSETIIKALESELSFYGQVLNFEPVDITSVPILNFGH